MLNSILDIFYNYFGSVNYEGSNLFIGIVWLYEFIVLICSYSLLAIVMFFPFYLCFRLFFNRGNDYV